MENTQLNTWTGEKTGAYTEKVKLLFDRYFIQDSVRNVNGFVNESTTDLSLALMEGCDIKTIKILLEMGANVNKANSSGQSPLCIALHHPECNSDLVHLLLKAGASEHACRMHDSLLHCYSINAKQIDPCVLKLLLIKQIGMPRFFTESLCSALSSKVCRADVVKTLLEMGCHVNKCLLHESSFHCYFDERFTRASESKSLDEEVVKLLLGNVSEVKKIYGSLQSPLCFALNHSKCSLAIVKLFLEAKAEFRKCYLHRSDFHCYIDIQSDADGFCTDRPLNVDILKLFLDRGADIHLVDSFGLSALYMALHFSDCSADTLRLLLDAGASMSGCLVHRSLLMCYVKSNEVRADAVKLLLNRGVDVHEVVYDKETALHAALRFSKYEVAAIEMLMDHPGFDANQKGQNESSFLHCALQNSYFERAVVELLLKKGARTDAVDSRGYTALQIAVRNPYCGMDIIKMLLDNGCPLFREGKTEITPLEMVLRGTRKVDIARLLLTSGAPIHVKRNKDDPPLLRLVLTLYDVVKKEEELQCLEMFVKFALLVAPWLDITKLIEEQTHSPFRRIAILNYANKCLEELKHMDMQYVMPFVTLRLFTAGLAKEVDLDALLKILTTDKFPMYYDIISTRVKRVWIEDALHESHAYLMSNLPCKGNSKVILDSNSTCHVGYFLSDQDLLSYLVVYYVSKGSQILPKWE